MTSGDGAGDMDIRIKQARIAVGIAATAMLATSGRASDGTITFIGAVTENGCAIQVDGTGSGDGMVALPVVDTTALDSSSAAHDTAAGTFFDITLSGCTASHADLSGAAPTQVAVYFEAGPNVDAATNALVNAGTSNVEVKLYLASGADVVGSQITPGASGAGQHPSQSVAATGAQHFYAGYALADGAKATAGTVSTSVTYSLVYN